MTEMGVIHGRFQILHNDHLKYLMAGKARCRHMVVGITNPDPTLTRTDPADPRRSSPEANPLTYFERYTMMRAVLIDEGLTYEQFSIVPFPINYPGLYQYYVPLSSVFYLTIYDQWGKRKLAQFQAAGLRTEVLWTKPRKEKGLTATDIRERIARGDEWEHLVPRASAELVNRWNIRERLRALFGIDVESAAASGS